MEKGQQDYSVNYFSFSHLYKRELTAALAKRTLDEQRRNRRFSQLTENL